MIRKKNEEAAAEAECNEHQTDLLVKGVCGKAAVEKISEIEKGRNFKIKNQDQVGSSLVSKNEGCAMDFGLSFGLMC